MAIAISGLAPLLEVFDLLTSIAFYRDVLGFELVSGMSRGGACSNSARQR
jgi:catechol 2,3-dioxygenase-like lactoylglutathione lyase family enzyme